jgi:hypothetical protein
MGIGLLVGVAPAIFFGAQAISRSRQAVWYMNLRAAVDANGRTLANIDSALGWLAVYGSLGWVVFLALLTFLG